jgi:hypothetical protein
MSVKITDRDRGWAALRKQIEQTKTGPHVAVGVFGTKAEEPHAGSKVANILIATVHEFGLGNQHERSFIRETVDIHAKEIAALCKKLAAEILEGKKDLKAALGLVGIYVQGLVRKRMSSSIPPPLGDAYAKRKGSSVTLIDTGQLRASIDFEVRNL